MCKIGKGVVFKERLARWIRSPIFWIATVVIDALIMLAALLYFDMI